MAKRKRSVGLIAFLKGNSDPAVGMPGCANHNHHYGGCLIEETCLVEQGKRCRYFERAVLPSAEGIGLKELVCGLYQKQVGMTGDITLTGRQIRRCPSCGAELKPRQRYCDSCRQRRRRASYRRSRQKRAGWTT